jgi:hypothetical protein
MNIENAQGKKPGGRLPREVSSHGGSVEGTTGPSFWG